MSTLANLPSPTLEGVISSLKEEEKRLKCRSGDATTNEDVKAFYARNGNEKNLKCHCCGRKGHVAAQCRHQDKPRLECNICGKVGNMENKCWSKNKHQSNVMINEASSSSHAGENLF